MRGAVAPAPAGAGAYFRFRKHFRIASLVERGNGLSSGPPRGQAGCRDTTPAAEISTIREAGAVPPPYTKLRSSV